uniref:histidine kinase n=1 Tax=Magnetococcus massalia (strain MO-1) TaxID=451514 RepID=A0A1S7LDW0_MAGMO|nr:putative histidine kinase with response regulator receptor domain [Candidatus Magnetococcus massalia]
MIDLATGAIRVAILLFIFIAFFRIQLNRDMLCKTGWQMMQWGFALLALGAALDLLADLGGLGVSFLSRQDPIQQILEMVVGYSGGLLLVVLGMARWVPSVCEQQKALKERNEAQAALAIKQQELSSLNESLEVRISEATADLQYHMEVAEEANRAKTEFLAAMSHEIRTPLNAILGSSELLAQTALSGEQQRYVDLFNSAGENLQRVINDILDLSRIEAGRMELEQVIYEPRRIVREVAEIFAQQMHEKGLCQLTRVDDEVPRYLVGDPNRIRQVLMNFVSNAAKFTEHGTVAMLIYLRMPEHDSHGQVVFSVVDTGMGIPEEKKQLVFSAFCQVDSSTSRHYGGSGLGLAICDRLANLMDGALKVQSSHDVGSSFSLLLPYHACKVEHNQIEPSPALLGKYALVYHDHPVKGCYFEELLSEMGFNVQSFAEASSIRELLEDAEVEKHILLIHHDSLTDDEIIHDLIELKKQKCCEGMPILLCGDLVEPSTLGKLERLKIAFTTRPYNPDLLEQSIFQVMGIDPQQEREEEQRAERKLKILLAEDSNDNVLLMRAFLKESGHHLEVVRNGREVVSRFCRVDSHFDVVLMDVQMPELDGYGATRQIRHWERKQGRPAVPILALTAHALNTHVEASYEAGCNAHLNKPIKKRALLEALQHYSH